MFMENSLIAVITRVESIKSNFKEQEEQLRKTQMVVESSNLGKFLSNDINFWMVSGY